MLICVLGFGHIWSAKPGRAGGPAAYFNTTGVLASGKYRHRSCVYGHIRIDECTGFHPVLADRWLFRVFESEPMTIWNGIRKDGQRPWHAEFKHLNDNRGGFQ